MGATRVRSRRENRTVSSAAGAKSRKVVVNFPEPLYLETTTVAAEVAGSYSEFIRLAVEQFLAERKQQQLERELAEGYIANAALAASMTEEFKFADAELL
jgi:metal-responsive CopG/Arc/MetJ family transcriptional regulator